MNKLTLAALVVGLLGACGSDPDIKIVSDGGGGSASTVCNPLAQTGCAANEKCTWLLDALEPQYVGHIGCAPKSDEDVDVGEACMFGTPGMNGFDNCKVGGVCSNFRGEPGVCKQICDQSGVNPACDDEHACKTYTDLFSTGESTPHAAGVCDHICDPMADNDYDGSASDGPGAFAKRGTECGSDANIGCYGTPKSVAPPTAFSCTRDYNYAKGADNGGVGLRHRARCTVETGCIMVADEYFLNACNQGYIPLLYESTEVSIAICVALCKPTNCYKDNCGASDANAQGIAGDTCGPVDRVFAGLGGDNWDLTEHCRYIWSYEINRDSGMFLPSKFSNTTGVCYSHTAYKFDKDGKPGAEEPLPPCSELQDGIGSATDPADPNYWGAAELGCVDTMHAGLGSAAAVGKATKVPERLLEKMRAADLPRPLYSREYAQ